MATSGTNVKGYLLTQDLRDEQPPHKGYTDPFIVFVVESGKVYSFDRTSTAADDGDATLKPSILASGDAGRYIKKTVA